MAVIPIELFKPKRVSAGPEAGTRRRKKSDGYVQKTWIRKESCRGARRRRMRRERRGRLGPPGECLLRRRAAAEAREAMATSRVGTRTGWTTVAQSGERPSEGGGAEGGSGEGGSAGGSGSARKEAKARAAEAQKAKEREKEAGGASATAAGRGCGGGGDDGGGGQRWTGDTDAATGYDELLREGRDKLSSASRRHLLPPPRHAHADGRPALRSQQRYLRW